MALPSRARDMLHFLCVLSLFAGIIPFSASHAESPLLMDMPRRLPTPREGRSLPPINRRLSGRSIPCLLLGQNGPLLMPF